MIGFIELNCKKATGNLWSICLGVNILSCLQSEILSTSLKYLYVLFLVSFLLLEIFHFQSKALRTSCLTLRSMTVFLRVGAFFSFSGGSFGLIDTLNFWISYCFQLLIIMFNPFSYYLFYKINNLYRVCFLFLQFCLIMFSFFI